MCNDVVRSAWSINENGSLSYVVARKLKNTMSSLIKWNREHFGNIQENIATLEKKLEEMQQNLQPDSIAFISGEELKLRKELEKMLELEEIQWAQRAHQL